MDLVYGSALWYTPARVNCHHLTERLAVARPTLFIESVGARPPRAHEWRRAAARLLRTARPLRRVGLQLWVYSPLPLPAWRGRGAEANSRWVGRQVRALLALRGWRVDACWVFHPMGLGTAEAVRAGGVIYYCVDDYAANPGVDAAALRALEDQLLARAHLAITTGEPLVARLRPGARRLAVLPNVADTELFGREAAPAAHPVLAALDALPHPRLGYLGNLAAYKVDLGLLRAIAEQRPAWQIALVGPANLGDTQRRVTAGGPPNLHLLGPIPHRLAPAVIDRFDVALLPSARHPVMRASFPLKFFEYLLRGKPVVARPMPQLEPYSAWFDAADGPADFVAAVERRLAGDPPDAPGRRRAFAAGFGWEDRMRELERLRAETLGAGA